MSLFVGGPAHRGIADLAVTLNVALSHEITI